MNIRKLFFNGQAFYPATILQAIKDHTNGKTLTTLLQELRDAIATKVDKVTGKSLVLDTEITKLAQYPTLTTGTDKYVREDGTLSPIAIGSGGHAANVYLSNLASDVATCKKLSYDPDAAQVEVSATSTNNVPALIASYIYDQPIGITDIDAGIWRFTCLGRVSNSQGITRLRAVVYKRATTGTETTLVQFDSDEINSTTNVRLLFETNTALFTVAATDRIGLKLYAITDSTTAKTVTVVIGGANSAYLNTPVAMRHNQLRAVNEDPNVQHMTADEKFAIGGVARKAFGYRLDTVDDQILIPKTALTTFGTGDFTIEVLFKLNARTTVFSYIFWNSTGGNRFGLYLENTSMTFSLSDGTNAYSANTPFANQANVDYHVICTIKNRIPYIYINGQLMGVGKDTTGISFDSAEYTIKINGSAGQKNNCNISLIRFYKHGFDQQDVDYYYNAGRPDLNRLSYSDKVNKTTTGCILELLPENATASKWLDTQNGLDGVTSGNPTINYGNCTPEPYIYPFKKYVGLEQNGDGTGFARFSVITNKTGKATIKGGFIVNSTNTQDIGKEVVLYKDVQTDIYIRLDTNLGELAIDNLIYISDFAKTANSPILSVDTSELPIRTALLGDTGTLVNKLYGSVSLIPRDTIDLRLAIPTGNNELTTGYYRELPRGVSYLYLNGTKIKGNFKNLPRKTDTTIIQNATSESSGITRDIPDSRVFELYGVASISGDIGELIGTFSSLVLNTTNANITYTNGIKVLPAFSRLILRPIVGVFTSAMTDQLLIDLAAQITSAVSLKIIDLTGNCGAPTAASSAARSYLSGLGFTVITN